MAIQRLTAAYRSRSRPSSTLGAKASTMCPYYLDGDLGRSPKASPGDTRFIGYCAVFKVREERRRRRRDRVARRSSASELGLAGLSKLNSMRPPLAQSAGAGLQARSTYLAGCARVVAGPSALAGRAGALGIRRPPWRAP
jgi:hypothetical protein